nr:MAG TPA: GIY-YIG nuclease superfamily protein [Bacteriophage sp.]
MKKYGVENFIVEELEYIKDDNKLSEREIYWINEL